MPITSDSVKTHFNIGSFNVDTTLTIPSSTLDNKFLLDIEKEIGAQLSNWDDAFPDIGFLLKITFEGAMLHKHPQFDNTSFATAPTDPDIIVNQDTGGVSPQIITYNRSFGMITQGDGSVANGKYVIEAKYVYFGLMPAVYIIESVTNTANLNYERKKPILSHWYDQGVPEMTISDAQNYTSNSVVAVVDTEFVLYPPMNQGAITNVFNDIQNITYNSFRTGGNEVNYTALITYNYPSFIVTTLENKYDSFVIYFLDWCATYNCLNELYSLATGENCSAKSQGIYQTNWLKATSLIQQIQIGLGCGKENISSLIEQLNETLDCECGCLDETPRQINSANVVHQDQIQFITATQATTPINLLDGHFIFINTSLLDGGSTELQTSNIEQYAEYTFIIKNDSQEPTNIIDFDSVFNDYDGQMPSITLGNPTTVITKFIATEANTLVLESLNVSGAEYQKPAVITSPSYEIDFLSGENGILVFANTDLEISATNLVEGSIYRITVRNSGASTQDITWDLAVFPYSVTESVLASGATGFTFMCATVSGNLVLIPC